MELEKVVFIDNDEDYFNKFSKNFEKFFKKLEIINLKNYNDVSEFVEKNLIKLAFLEIQLNDSEKILKFFKSKSLLLHVPIIVLTESQEKSDIKKAYELHSNCYLNKPYSDEEISKMLEIFDNFWFKIVQLPNYD